MLIGNLCKLFSSGKILRNLFMRSRHIPLSMFLMLSVASLSLVSLPASADDVVLPIDPDFVQTWVTEPTPVTAPTTAVVTTPKPVTKPKATNSQPTVTDADRDALARQNASAQALIDNQNEKSRIESLAADVISKYEALKQVQHTLSDELRDLDTEIENTNATVNAVLTESTETQNTIDQINNKVLLKQQEIAEQKKVVSAYVQAVYSQKDVSMLDLLLSNQTFADTLSDIDNVQSLESTGQVLFASMQAASEELKSQQDALKTKQVRLEKLLIELKKQQDALAEQQQSKRFLLEKTAGKEENYQAMILDFKAQAQQVEEDIQSLSADIAQFKSSNELARIALLYGEKFSLINPENGAIWPVDASYKGISAYFNDSGYLKFFGFPHSAIDIPQPAQTPIRAPANSVVLKVVDRDDGGYNYLVLYHGTDNEGKDITTVYGHLPKIFVAKGDVVRQGDIIALTGGAPGTRGTGPYYTGPHLHFEVRQNGKAIDPLSWLP